MAGKIHTDLSDHVEFKGQQSQRLLRSWESCVSCDLNDPSHHIGISPRRWNVHSDQDDSTVIVTIANDHMDAGLCCSSFNRGYLLPLQ